MSTSQGLGSKSNKGSSVTTSSSVERIKGKVSAGKTYKSVTGSSSQHSEDHAYQKYFVPTYFGKGGEMKQSEQEMDWNSYMNKPMSLQHKVIVKLKMFSEQRFDIVLIGDNRYKNKLLGNMMFKCFLDPLGKDIEDYIGQSYAEGRADANMTINLDNAEETKLIKEMLSVKEDKIRYTQINVLKVYGLGLRFHIAGSIDKSESIAASVAQQQIIVMANYLSFKKKYKSGFGMNSFILLLDFKGKLNQMTVCTIELLMALFGVDVFNSTIFLIEVDDDSEENKEKISNDAKSAISQKACCKHELIHVLPIKTLSEDSKKPAQDYTEELVKETTAAATLKILNEVAIQTYVDPNPFEPEGMDYHDALVAVDVIKKKYQPKDKDWYNIINNVYTMLPN